MTFTSVIRNAQIVDGSGAPAYYGDLAISGGHILRIAPSSGGGFSDSELRQLDVEEIMDARGLVLAPGFIDVHTHDDLAVIHNPQVPAKITQGVTTVVVGNCGISASPVSLDSDPPDPLNLLGPKARFCYPNFSDYARAVQKARPNVNVAALIGHTSLRNNHMSSLQRTATQAELTAMKQQLRRALQQGAIGLSSGLAYGNAKCADTAEVLEMVSVLAEQGGVYTTHLRTEFEQILEAIDEALLTAREHRVPLIISHLKCAGRGNWGRSDAVLSSLESAAKHQTLACDCYPYTASSSTLDLAQVTDDIDIFITWSEPYPDQGGRPLAEIAKAWNLTRYQAAQRLQPAGAVYHCMSDSDVQNILRHPLTMVGSDGLPNDPHPHPRLWGAFPRVLAHYGRELGLLDLPQAVHKMTGLSAKNFGLQGRGLIREGFCADLVLFDYDALESAASYSEPQKAARGIHRVWVNGVCSYSEGKVLEGRSGAFLFRSAR
ncbi:MULTISPECIES: N-acyl-D-amino-acid deacylase family protein [Microbulbifer]|uniref:Amidohydrolase family protein n=1 Tax=Microbulbifer celer TaxID=435905 RepID=A0ABW3U4D1_9GAMM|nr:MULTISPECIES: D-aminoacylase [Microbulbifer]UFN57640.1 D-aminoacylase [Microbulbifer celer]